MENPKYLKINTHLNNPSVKGGATQKTRKYFELNEKENTSLLNFVGYNKGSVQRKIYSISAYIKKENLNL